MCRLHLLGNFNIRRFTSVSLASHFQTDLLKSNVARLLATVSIVAAQCATKSQTLQGSTVPTLHTFSLSTYMHVRHVAAVIPVVTYRCQQQLLHCNINKLGVLWVTATPSKVTPDPRDYPQLCIRHLANFIFLICDWKVQVSLSWHHQRLGLDACQCLYMIAVKAWSGTDITILQKRTHNFKLAVSDCLLVPFSHLHWIIP